MKAFVTLVLISIGLTMKAQIALEHVYDSSSTFSNSSQLMIINFEISGEKYVKIDRVGKSISIYDLNHSFNRSFSYSAFPQNSNGIPTILYISEQLFDPDPMIEYLYLINDASINYSTSIYKEDGSLIFFEPNAAPWIRVNVPQQQYPIYNTSQGTKMILSCQGVNQTKVFSLPGTLSTSIQNSNLDLVESSELFVGGSSPNPTNVFASIPYSLPEGVGHGEILLFDLEGREVRHFQVDDTFSNLLISTADVPAGTYYYQLRVDNLATPAKRMVVIR